MQNVLPNLLTLVSFVFFTGLVGLGTWLLTRKDKHDTNEGYFLGGRTLTGGYIAGSLLLTNLSTEQLVGLNGDAYGEGLSVMAWEVLAAASLVIMAFYFLPKFLRSGIATVPQFLEERYGSSTNTITTFIFVVAYAAILLPIVLFTGASGLIGILDLESVTGIDQETTYQMALIGEITGRQILLWGTVWFTGIVGSIYAIFGGLRTVAVSDTLNGFGLLIGGCLIAYLGLKAVNPDGILPALNEMRTAHPDRFNSLGTGEEAVTWHSLFTGVLLLNLFYWCTNQQIIQRTFGASNLAEGQKGVLLAGFFKALTPIILVLPGMIAFNLYAGESLERDRVYGRLVQDVLPWYLTGFFAAVVVGAILSSFNSALNSTATLFSLGIYKKLLRPMASDEEVIGSGKWFGWIIAIASMSLAPMLDGADSIFGYLQMMNGIYFIPIFAVIIVGLFFRRVPASAANLALILGPILIGIFYLVPIVTDWLSEQGGQYEHYHVLLSYPAGMLVAIGKYHQLGAVFALLIALMLLIGAFRPREFAWKQRDSGEVDMTPWPYAIPSGIVLLIFVGFIYWYFADFSVVTDGLTGYQSGFGVSWDVIKGWFGM